MGNHLNDLGRLEAFGWPATPKDANPIAIAKAVIVSSKNGGKGAVREISKIILAQMPDDEGKGAPMTKPIFLLGAQHRHNTHERKARAANPFRSILLLGDVRSDFI